MNVIVLAGIIVSAYLLLLAIKDLRTWNKRGLGIPSIYTDIFMLVAFAFAFNSIEAKIFVGLLSFLVGLVLVDLQFFKGEADLKALVGIGITMPTMVSFFMFVLILSMLKLAYVFYFKKIKKGVGEEMPLLPFFLVAYLCTLLAIIL